MSPNAAVRYQITRCCCHLKTIGNEHASFLQWPRPVSASWALKRSRRSCRPSNCFSVLWRNWSSSWEDILPISSQNLFCCNVVTFYLLYVVRSECYRFLFFFPFRLEVRLPPLNCALRISFVRELWIRTRRKHYPPYIVLELKYSDLRGKELRLMR